MYYRTLGNTGLQVGPILSLILSLLSTTPKPCFFFFVSFVAPQCVQVSVFSYGFWASFGSKGDMMAQEGIDKAKALLQQARLGGINFFDNAETYGNPQGSAELIMGEAIRQLRLEDANLWRRSSILISTKIYWGGSGTNETGLSRKHIFEGVNAALKRLQVDYVDMLYCHRPDPITPTETVVRAMTEMVRSGKAMSWGTSEWSAQQITEAFYLAKLHNLEPPQYEQPEYHMFARERVEREYAPLYQQPYNYGTTIWSPLASGLLTGKYNTTIPAGSRLNSAGYEWLVPRLKAWRESGKIETVKSLTTYAEKTFKCSVSQLALAWCVKNPNVTTVLLGATKPEQLAENLAAIRVAAAMTGLTIFVVVVVFFSLALLSDSTVGYCVII